MVWTSGRKASPTHLDRKELALALKLMVDGFVMLPEKLQADELRSIIAETENLSSDGQPPSSAYSWAPGEVPKHAEILVRHVSFLTGVLGADYQHLRSWIRSIPSRTSGAKWHQDHDMQIAPVPVIIGIYLESTSIGNGATEVVPSTHHFPHPEHDSTGYASRVAIEGESGTMFAFLASIWHRGGINSSPLTRTALFVEFCAKSKIRTTISPEKYQEFTCRIQD